MKPIISEYANQLKLIEETSITLNKQKAKLDELAQSLKIAFFKSNIQDSQCVCKIEDCTYLLKFYEEDGSLIEFTDIANID